MITDAELKQIEARVAEEYQDASEADERVANLLHDIYATKSLRERTADMLAEIDHEMQPHSDMEAREMIMYYLGRIQATLEHMTDEIRSSTRQILRDMGDADPGGTR